MSNVTFEDVLEQALALEPEEQLHLAEHLTHRIRILISDQNTNSRSTPVQEHQFTDAEIADLMHSEPMTGAEIVAAGLTGTWADLGIKDGADWVNTQKQKRRERNQW